MGRWGLVPHRNEASTAEFASTAVGVGKLLFRSWASTPVRGRTFDNMTRAQLEAPLLRCSSARTTGTAASRASQPICTEPQHPPQRRGLHRHRHRAPQFRRRQHQSPRLLAAHQPPAARPIPVTVNSGGDRESLCCRLLGRLAPGVTIEQAQAEMTVFFQPAPRLA